MSIVCLNGALLAAEEARLAATSPGLLLGAGIFETLRAVSGVGFLLERHYRRLALGAERLGIAVPFHLETLEYYVRRLEEANLREEGRLRITLLRPAEEGGEPDFLIQLHPLAPQPASFRVTCGEFGRTPRSPLAGIKSTSYLDFLLLRESATRQGFDEILLLDERGRLLEGAASNVFLVRDGEILTPEVRSGILPGVTRGFLLEKLPEWGRAARERALTLDDLEAADEVFCSNAVIGVMPVSQIEDKPLCSTRPGAVSRELAAAYRRAVVEYVEKARAG